MSQVDWMPDKDVYTCTRCLTIQFSLTVRKHHCRFCGFVVCNYCSKHRLFSEATGVNERCCDPCMKKAELSTENLDIIAILTTHWRLYASLGSVSSLLHTLRRLDFAGPHSNGC
jgi:hypothetical protein